MKTPQKQKKGKQTKKNSSKKKRPAKNVKSNNCREYDENELEGFRNVVVVSDDSTPTKKVPAYRDRYVQYTSDPELLIVYAHPEKLKYNDVNPAWHELEMRGYDPKNLNIPKKITKKFLKHVHFQHECRQNVHGITDHVARVWSWTKANSSKHVDVNMILYFFSQKVLEFMVRYVPTWAKDLYGFVGGMVPNWMKRVFSAGFSTFKKLISSPVLLMLATTLYTTVKAFICIYTLPNSSIKIAKGWLLNQLGSVSPTVDTFIKYSEVLLTCSAGSFWSCAVKSIKAFFASIKMVSKWSGALVEYVLPMQNEFSELKNYTFGALDNYLRADIYQIRRVLGAKVIDGEILETLVQSYLPKMYLNVFDLVVWVMTPMINDPAQLALLKTVRNIIAAGYDIYRKIQAAINLSHYNNAKILIRFIVDEIVSLTDCLVNNTNCCFSDSLINVWKSFKSPELEKELMMFGYNNRGLLR